jgi:helicase
MKDIFEKIPKEIQDILKKQNISQLRPCQEQSIKKGLFSTNKNQLVCTPTGSGKTLVAEMAMLQAILLKKRKVIYIVPLKALASEKYKEFVELYGNLFKVRISIGEIQNEQYVYDYDLLLVTAEKLDSLMRNNREVLEGVGLVIADEIHLINDEKRGPTLEILLSIFKSSFYRVRIIGLSATIGNYQEIGEWLNAEVIYDEWRPVELEHHVLLGDELLKYK